MLSYRHRFHAGNFADVLKHLTLIYLIDYLNKKDKSYRLLDTHSGAGRYPLKSADAEKTQEFNEGVSLIFEQRVKHPTLKTYRNLLKTLNPNGLSLYPGSPLLASLLTRPQDRLVFNEIHPQDSQRLEQLFSTEKRVQIHHQDAYALLKATLPFAERRGLILIDPSYEIKQEYQLLPGAIKEALKRFATGIYAIWYPVINRQSTESFLRTLIEAAQSQSRPTLRLEHCPLPDTNGLGMSGSGMLVINPPYTLADDFQPLMQELQGLLTQGKPGRVLIKKTD